MLYLESAILDTFLFFKKFFVTTTYLIVHPYRMLMKIRQGGENDKFLNPLVYLVVCIVQYLLIVNLKSQGVTHEFASKYREQIAQFNFISNFLLAIPVILSLVLMLKLYFFAARVKKHDVLLIQSLSTYYFGVSILFEMIRQVGLIFLYYFYFDVFPTGNYMWLFNFLLDRSSIFIDVILVILPLGAIIIYSGFFRRWPIRWLVIPLCSIGGIYWLVTFYTFESRLFIDPGGRQGLTFFYQETFDEKVCIKLKPVDSPGLCYRGRYILYNGSGEDILLTTQQEILVDVSHYRDPAIAGLHNQGFRLDKITASDSIAGTGLYRVKNNEVARVDFFITVDSDPGKIFAYPKIFSMNYFEKGIRKSLDRPAILETWK